MSSGVCLHLKPKLEDKVCLTLVQWLCHRHVAAAALDAPLVHLLSTCTLILAQVYVSPRSRREGSLSAVACRRREKLR